MEKSFGFSATLVLLVFAFTVTCIEGKEQTGITDSIEGSSQKESFRSRIVKRDLSSQILEAAGNLGVGTGFIKKFNTLINGVPPNVKEAFVQQDFSNVSEADIRKLNISVLEYIPPKILQKLNLTLLTPIVDRLLQANRPMAMGRVMSAVGDKMDTNSLLDRISTNGGMKDSNEEAANVLLYSALHKAGDKDGIDFGMVQRLEREGLLNLVPEEQLMKVRDSHTAKYILRRLYHDRARDPEDQNDIDDKALMYKLSETTYGPAPNWTKDTLQTLGARVVSFLPAAFLQKLNSSAITSSISIFREIRFESPLQGKTVTDLYMEKAGIPNKETDGANKTSGNLAAIMSQLSGLAAYVNPRVSKDTLFQKLIIESCNKLNLPAPIRSVTEMIRNKVGSKGTIQNMRQDDVRNLGMSVLKNGPPQLANRAIETKALGPSDLQEIGNQNPNEKSMFSNTFFQGLIAQVATYAVTYFTSTKNGRVDFGNIPGAFWGALGLNNLKEISDRDLTDAMDTLRNNPDALDDAQKAQLLKRLREAGLVDGSNIPPEFRGVKPRSRNSNRPNNLDGLPSDAELRLLHGNKNKITAIDLENDKFLVGTLTPTQVQQMNLNDIPAVLSIVRKSKDGPQAQTLEALSKRFAEYIRLKAEDYDSPDKKLLKHISAAEVSKLPATVLAYFIDARQTAKLPADVRKEIMIAMGELSTKDHALIPSKTREEIILQGLAALDSMTGGASSKKLDVAELAAVGHGVADLPPARIEKLTPTAVEQALPVIQGTADDDDDGLKQRACLTPAQKQAWKKQIFANYGQPKTWDAPTVMVLCCSLGLLDEGELLSIAPDAISTCRCVSDTKPRSHLVELKNGLEANCKHELDGKMDNVKTKMDKVKAEAVFDLDDLESQIIAGRRRRRRDTTDEKLSCFKVRLTGTAVPFSTEQLQSLPDNEMTQCLYELGLEPLSKPNALVLWKKLVSAKKSVQNLKADTLRYAGYILSGITLQDVSSLQLANWDIVMPFGRPLGLSKNVLEKLAINLEEKQRRRLPEFTTIDLAYTRNILCGFPANNLTGISSEAFRDALPILKNLDSNCEQTRLGALSSVTMRPTIFGDPKNWTAAEVRGVGILLGGLPESVIQLIPPEAFLGVTPSVAAGLPETTLGALSANQTSYFPRFSAQTLSEAQVAAVKDDARSSLQQVLRGPSVSLAPKLHSYFSTLFSSIFPCILLTISYSHF